MMGAAFVKWYEGKTMNDKLQLFEDQPISELHGTMKMRNGMVDRAVKDDE